MIPLPLLVFMVHNQSVFDKTIIIILQQQALNNFDETFQLIVENSNITI